MLPPKAPGAGRPPRKPPRALRARATTFAAVLAVAAIGGCDDDEQATEPGGGRTDLTIALDADGPGGQESGEALVRCAGEAIPSRSACVLVDGLPPDPAAPIPPDVACTEIYGGPDVARLEGTLRGERVETELTRANGCEIDRFDRFTPLLRELHPGYRPGESIPG